MRKTLGHLIRYLLSGMIALFLFNSCGKKKKPHIAQYGPVVLNNSTQLSIEIQNCQLGEVIECRGEFTYNTGFISNLETGASCTNQTAQILVFELISCEDANEASSWKSNSITCTGTSSQFKGLKPLSFEHVAC